MLEWLKRHAWKACLRQKRNGGSNPPHSADFPFAGGVFGNVVLGGKMLQDVASGSRMLDKCWTKGLNVGQKHENRERMKGINVSLCCRARCGKDGTTPLVLSVCYDRKTAFLPVGIRLRPEQWDRYRRKVVNHQRAANINSFLQTFMGRVEDAVMDIQRDGGVQGMDAIEIKDAIAGILFPKETDDSLVGVMERYRDDCRKPNTRDKYDQTLLHLNRYLGASARKVMFSDVTADFLSDFDRHMEKIGLAVNSRSIHMRNIRTVFNYALAHELTTAHYPFKKFKIKSATKEPLVLTLEQMKLLWHHVPKSKAQRYWLDVWKLMFCLIGINMADLWELEKVVQGRVSYERQKTGRLYSIKVEPEAKALIKAHKGRKSLVDVSERSVSVKRATVAINRRLKDIAQELELPPFTVYTARYTWATLAQSIDIPIEVISQALGHTYGMAVTLGYIMPDRRKMDEANRKVLDLLNA